MSGPAHDLDAEKAVLVSALAGARRHVLDQVTALGEAHRRAVVVPSGWSPLGLVRHLTLSDEHFWFEVVVAGRPLRPWPSPADGGVPGPDPDWVVHDDEDSDAVLDAYRRAVEVSEGIVAATDLDAPTQGPPDWAAPGEFADLRSVLVHVLVETSTHAGHLDVVRELLDGGQHLVL